jgi:esterase/lipase superfamily enzyme
LTIGYSAGGRVLTRALVGLREKYPDLSAEELHELLKIDRAYFVAADVPLDAFLHALPAMHDVARHVIFTVSDDDIALEKADQFMGGAPRAGEERTILEPHERAVISSLPRVHILDVSYGKAERGFDITGHHYWHKHPWVSSEIIMAMLTDLRGEDRGLEHAELGQVWYLTPDYPDRVRRSARDVFQMPALEGQDPTH